MKLKQQQSYRLCNVVNIYEAKWKPVAVNSEEGEEHAAAFVVGVEHAEAREVGQVAEQHLVELEEENLPQEDSQTAAVVAVEVRREDSHQEAFRIVVHVVVVQGVFQIVAAAVEEGEAEAKYKRLKDTNTSEGKWKSWKSIHAK